MFQAAILEELRGLRADVQKLPVSAPPHPSPDPRLRSIHEERVSGIARPRQNAKAER
jgi:hypothetical protein